MPVQLNNGSVFLHIPKTGGTFVTEYLKVANLSSRTFGHIHGDASDLRLNAMALSPAAQIRHRLQRVLPATAKKHVKTRFSGRLVATREEYEASRPFVFCFVREPLSWYESFFRYMVGRAGTDWTREPDYWGWHPCRALIPHGTGRFSDFIEAVVEHEPGFVTQLYNRYVHDGIDFVGRQEELREDLATALTMSGCEIDVDTLRDHPAANESQQHVDTSWPQALRDRVAELEHGALVRFGYTDT